MSGHRERRSLRQNSGKQSSVKAAVSQVNLGDLAKYLGLSTTTVSRVINRSPSAKAIPLSTQERVFAAAAKLNYRPNMMAQSLRRQRSYTIGVIVPEIGEGYSSTVLNGIEHALVSEGYFFFVVSHMHRAKLLDEYPHLLVDRAVEGIIAVDTAFNKPIRVPVVNISGHHHVKGQTNIVVNHRRAAELALGHLHELGHRRIAVVKGQSFSSDTTTRWEAIRYTAKRLKLELDPKLVVQLETDSFTSEPGYIATQALVRSGVPFTAVFAFNDISAIGAIRALREAGLRVPKDVSVVGFDDIPSAAFQNPALTTIRQPLKTMGLLAVEHLLKRIRTKPGVATSERIIVEPELVVRDTTAVANANGRVGVRSQDQNARGVSAVATGKSSWKDVPVPALLETESST